MPAETDDITRGAMVIYRSLDYTKKEIAEELDISRQTVSKHLAIIREEAEESNSPGEVVAEYVTKGRVETDSLNLVDTATGSGKTARFLEEAVSEGVAKALVRSGTIEEFEQSLGSTNSVPLEGENEEQER